VCGCVGVWVCGCVGGWVIWGARLSNAALGAGPDELLDEATVLGLGRRDEVEVHGPRPVPALHHGPPLRALEAEAPRAEGVGQARDLGPVGVKVRVRVRVRVRA
jgi:hypothetical protein